MPGDSNTPYRAGFRRLQENKAIIVCFLSIIGFVVLRERNRMSLEVIPQTNEKYTGCFIFLHGATRNGVWQKRMFLDLMGDKAAMSNVKIIFPTSPVKYMDIMNRVTNVWFNSKKSEKEGEHSVASLSDIDESVKTLTNIVEDEVKNGIPANRIVIGGISQGGMVALHAVYRALPEVAGCIAVSSVVPHEEEVVKAIKSRTKNPPVYMLNGNEDQIVPTRFAKETFERLVKVDPNIKITIFQNGEHELIQEELTHAYDIVKRLIPDQL